MTAAPAHWESPAERPKYTIVKRRYQEIAEEWAASVEIPDELTAEQLLALDNLSSRLTLPVVKPPKKSPQRRTRR